MRSLGLACLLLLGLFLPGSSWSAITGTWTTTGSTSASTTVSGTTVTHTAQLGIGQNYSNQNFQSSTSWWDNPYEGMVSAGTGLSGSYQPTNGSITVVVTFSAAVDDPVLHINGIGYTQGPQYKSTIWALTSSVSQGAAVTMQRLSGNPAFQVDASGFSGNRSGTASNPTPGLPCANSGVSSGCGSVRLNGTGITRLTFTVTSSNLGFGQDSVGMRWSFADAPKLTLRKAVVNDNGGTATPGDFTLEATNGATTISGKMGEAAITNATVSAGTYTLGEDVVDGYAASAYSCVLNGGSAVSGNSITLANGDAAVCTVTNDDQIRAGTSVSGRVFLDNGVGGGIANDGVLNGGESPLAGSAVRLTDCGSNVLSSATTEGSGRYSLSVPTATAMGTALCVEQANAAGRISTGASADGTALPSGMAITIGSSAYTYSRASSPERIAFVWSGASHGRLDFGDVDASGFAASGARTAAPGNTVSFAHTFRAATAGTVRFGIASTSATPAVNGWSASIFADPGCTGILQPGATQLYPPADSGTAVASGSTVCVVVRQFVPATAPPGSNGTLHIEADFDHANANPGLNASYSVIDTTTVSAVALDLRKEVRNITQGGNFGVNNTARSGETLEYRITFTNNGDGPIKSLAIHDVAPAHTSFLSADANATPAALGNCTKRTPANASPSPAAACALAQPAGGTGPIEWAFSGTLDPGGTASVQFRVKID